MNFFSKNIRFLRLSKGLTQSDFEKVGIKGGTLSNYELGKTEPKIDMLISLSKFFGISVGDLLSTDLENCPPNNAPPNASPLNEKLPSIGEKGILANNDYVIPYSNFQNDETVSIPIVNVDVAAGMGIYNQDYLEVESELTLPVALVKRDRFYVGVRVRGESMAPTLMDSSYVIAYLLDKAEWREIKNDHIYVIGDKEGKGYVKRVRNRFNKNFIVLTSDNIDKANYRNFNLMADEINTLWYVQWYLSARMENINETYYSKVTQLENEVEDIKEILGQMRMDIVKRG